MEKKRTADARFRVYSLAYRVHHALVVFRWRRERSIYRCGATKSEETGRNDARLVGRWRRVGLTSLFNSSQQRY